MSSMTCEKYLYLCILCFPKGSHHSFEHFNYNTVDKKKLNCFAKQYPRTFGAHSLTIKDLFALLWFQLLLNCFVAVQSYKNGMVIPRFPMSGHCKLLHGTYLISVKAKVKARWQSRQKFYIFVSFQNFFLTKNMIFFCH